jgi:hypothetical protein
MQAYSLWQLKTAIMHRYKLRQMGLILGLWHTDREVENINIGGSDLRSDLLIFGTAF